jgi:teichuronic acid biosynthesis glycosyltransferase TuaH
MTAVAQPVERTVANAAPARDLVLILPFTSWSGQLRRASIHSEDRLTLHALGSSRVRRLLVCNPYRSRATKLVRSVVGPADAPFPTVEGRHLYEPLRLRRDDPTTLRGVRRATAAYEHGVRLTAGRLGLERPAVIVLHPLIAGFGDFGWAGPVTYYATDDMAAFEPLRRWWPAYEVSFERLRSTGRRVVGVAPALLERVGSRGPSMVLPNGIEPTEWLVPAPPPAWFTALPTPRLLYVGTLDDRLDVAQVEALAAAYPAASVVLVGRCPDPDRYASLEATLNVTLRPSVERDELAGLLAAADVGLIPHVRSSLTEAMSPLKLFEYLASGIPVAAVDLPGVRGVCPDRCSLASGPDDFPGAVARALELGRWDDGERREFVRENAWGRRLDELLDLALAP